VSKSSRVLIPGGARLTQTVVSGDIDVALTGGAAVNAMLSGADIILCRHAGTDLRVFGSTRVPRSKTVEDLRGKVLGVITKGASSDHASIALLRRHNMSQGRDVKVLYFSRQEDALAALNQGIVSAAVHSPPTTLMARRLGFKELVNIGALKIPYPFTGLAVRRALVKQNPEVIRSFLKCYIAGIKVAVEQPDTARRVLARYLVTKDAEIIDEAVQRLCRALPRVPYVTEEAIRAAIGFTDHPQGGNRRPERFL
jgi:ABC-type nitrate/sulfonate/bicarbonate transport system substrate-binding protein